MKLKRLTDRSGQPLSIYKVCPRCKSKRVRATGYTGAARYNGWACKFCDEARTHRENTRHPLDPSRPKVRAVWLDVYSRFRQEDTFPQRDCISVFMDHGLKPNTARFRIQDALRGGYMAREGDGRSASGAVLRSIGDWTAETNGPVEVVPESKPLETQEPTLPAYGDLVDEAAEPFAWLFEKYPPGGKYKDGNSIKVDYYMDRRMYDAEDARLVWSEHLPAPWEGSRVVHITDVTPCIGGCGSTAVVGRYLLKNGKYFWLCGTHAEKVMEVRK